jgi:hypothetical protein
MCLPYAYLFMIFFLPAFRFRAPKELNPHRQPVQPSLSSIGAICHTHFIVVTLICVAA